MDIDKVVEDILVNNPTLSDPEAWSEEKERVSNIVTTAVKEALGKVREEIELLETHGANCMADGCCADGAKDTDEVLKVIDTVLKQEGE